jgi:predicted nucleotidyltransferase
VAGARDRHAEELGQSAAPERVARHVAATATRPGVVGRRLCYDALVPTVEPVVYDALTRVASTAPSLQMLLLHGSRARNDAHAQSDWDFAYEADASFDPDALLAALADALDADRIDLVDLDRAGALLRHRVARDGVVLFEREPGRFDRFWLNAVTTWCDLAPVLEPLYSRVLQTTRA